MGNRNLKNEAILKTVEELGKAYFRACEKSYPMAVSGALLPYTLMSPFLEYAKVAHNNISIICGMSKVPNVYMGTLLGSVSFGGSESKHAFPPAGFEYKPPDIAGLLEGVVKLVQASKGG